MGLPSSRGPWYKRRNIHLFILPKPLQPVAWFTASIALTLSQPCLFLQSSSLASAPPWHFRSDCASRNIFVKLRCYQPVPQGNITCVGKSLNHVGVSILLLLQLQSYRRCTATKSTASLHGENSSKWHSSCHIRRCGRFQPSVARPARTTVRHRHWHIRLWYEICYSASVSIQYRSTWHLDEQHSTGSTWLQWRL